MKTIIKPLAFILVLALGLPACSHYSKTARSQRAYQKYVHKSMAKRSHQQKKIAKSQAEDIPAGELSPWKTTATAESAEAASSESAQQ